VSENIIPIIYEESKIKVLNGLKERCLDYLDLADWTFQDKFFAFMLGIRFLRFALQAIQLPGSKKRCHYGFYWSRPLYLAYRGNALFHCVLGIQRSPVSDPSCLFHER